MRKVDITEHIVRYKRWKSILTYIYLESSQFCPTLPCETIHFALAALADTLYDNPSWESIRPFSVPRNYLKGTIIDPATRTWHLKSRHKLFVYRLTISFYELRSQFYVFIIVFSINYSSYDLFESVGDEIRLRHFYWLVVSFLIRLMKRIIRRKKLISENIFHLFQVVVKLD